MPFFVFDLDGTLADIKHRLHHVKGDKRDYRAFFDACHLDLPNPPVVACLKAHVAAGHRVEVWSARSDEVRDKTEAWLATNGIDPLFLRHMRPAGDHVQDRILKARWLEQADPKPDAIYDDRQSVVDMWRAAGVPCFMVGPNWEKVTEKVVMPSGDVHKLILMIGPSGAGKSDIAAAAFPPDWIISTDRLRAQLMGEFKNQDRNDDVFLAVRRIATARLLSGLSTVIDATHLHRKTRIEHVKLAPEGVPVVYYVVDRPLEEKINTGGWRNDVKFTADPDKMITLIEKHHQHFQSQLKDILAGDGLLNATVMDTRDKVAA